MTVEVSVPATIANLGPGFDAMAAAVTLRDRFRVARTDRPSVRFAGEDAESLNALGETLLARAAEAVARREGVRASFAITADLAVPVARGLGSSAASIVGGVVGTNRLLGDPMTPQTLLEVAAEIEGHPDNVAAALFGGVVVVAAEGTRLHWMRVQPRLELRIVLAVPERRILTQEARAVLPRTVPLQDAVFNLSRAALLVGALLSGDAAALSAALDDRLHQPARARLLPGFPAVVAAARDAGAYGAVLAGSGSAVAAFVPPERGTVVGAAMVESFHRHEVAAAGRVLEIDPHGAIIHE